jgi:hypothetical protein
MKEKIHVKTINADKVYERDREREFSLFRAFSIVNRDNHLC